MRSHWQRSHCPAPRAQKLFDQYASVNCPKFKDPLSMAAETAESRAPIASCDALQNKVIFGEPRENTAEPYHVVVAP